MKRPPLTGVTKRPPIRSSENDVDGKSEGRGGGKDMSGGKPWDVPTAHIALCGLSSLPVPS